MGKGSSSKAAETTAAAHGGKIRTGEARNFWDDGCIQGRVYRIGQASFVRETGSAQRD
jgi:hypothetical protein